MGAKASTSLPALPPVYLSSTSLPPFYLSASRLPVYIPSTSLSVYLVYLSTSASLPSTSLYTSPFIVPLMSHSELLPA